MLKQKFKTLSLRLLLAIVAIMALPDVANAATFSGGQKFYLVPGQWSSDGAKYAIYVFGSSGNGWSDIMTDNDGDGIYEGTAPNGTWNNLILVRMNSDATSGNWDNDWNQSADLTFDGKNNMYVFTGWSTFSTYQYGNKVKFNYNSTDYEVTSGSNGEFSYTPSYLDGNASFYVKVNNTNSNYKNYSPASETAISTDGTKSTWTNNATNKWTYTADPKKEYTIHTNVYNREVWVTYTDATITGVKLDLKGETVTSAPYTWTYTHSGETVTKTLTATNVYSNSYEETAATLDYEFVDGGIYTITYADGAITIDAQLPKQLTKVELTGLDGVSVGDATPSGNVCTWSFTYSGETKATSVTATETYDDNSTESSNAVETTLYNGSDYVITYNVETNELTITPTHKLVSVTCNITATQTGEWTWTYAHTAATETKTIEFVETWTNGTDPKSEEKEFNQGSFYTITYNTETNEVSYDEVAESASAPTITIENTTVTDAAMTEEDGVYTYKYTLNTTSGEVLNFNFKRVYTNSNIAGYERVEYIVPSSTQTADANGVGYTVSADGSTKFNATFSPDVETTIALETTLVKVYEKAPVEITLYGLADNNWEPDNAGYIITDDNKDGIYEYKFIFTGSETYFHFKASDGTTTEYYTPLSNDDDTKLITTSPLSYAVHSSNPNISFHYNFLENEEYRIVLDTNNETAYVQFVSKGNATTGANSVKIAGNPKYGLTDIAHDNIGGAIEMSYAGNNVYTWTYDYTQANATTDLLWTEYVIDNVYYSTQGNSSVSMEEGLKYTLYDRSGGGQYETHNFSYLPEYSSVTVYVNAVTKQVWITRTIDASYKSGIPVYPLGVSTEGELAAYDFTNNPVYYLCSPVLNDNRISPEWQMEKDEDDGKFYIRGFAMRNTNARDNGDYLEEGNIKVVQYTSAEQEDGTECVEISYNETGDENPWSEGRLYDACYDPAEGTLTLTKVVDRMPFISMVGYNFQQLEKYATPRNSNTSHGWQEAWILYDENGEIVKDRNGKVLYNTMWPPKNPVYFNAAKGTERIELSSNNLTFSAVEDYDVKTGDAWKAKLTDDAYANLSLDSDTEYIRYKIDYMWILGATKIWTGWGGQSASWGSQWDNHMNWGYGSDTGNESGAAIESQESYTLAQNAGNFLVAEPTYFQTVEFFYNVGNPSSSVFYTTLAHGNPSIRAKATEDYHGNYDIEVKDADGLAITAYTVTRYNAVTNEIVSVKVEDVEDNGIVNSETGDWTADTFNDVTWVDDKELANGKYYYELTITIDGENVTVYSNPFTIYRPADHQTEVKVMQLLEVSDNTYVTVPLTAEGQLDKSVLIESVTVAADGEITVTEVADQADAISAIENGSYQWTMKTLLSSEVPATWTDEMGDTAEDTMQDGVVTNWNLTVNGTEVIKVAPNAKSNMLYIYDHSVPSTNSYKATMDYTYTLNDVVGTKATIGKETAFTLNAPQAIAGQNELSVTRGTGATITGNVIPQNGTNMVKLSAVEEEFVNPFFQPMDEDEGKEQTEIEETNLQSADTYEQVDVTFNFTMPSISEEVYNECVVAYMPKLTAYKGGAIVQQKYLSLIMDSEFSDALKAIKVTGIDPTWEEVELSIATQYYDKEDMSSFVEGRFGTAPVMEKEVSFVANEILSVGGKVWEYERMERKEQEGQHYIGTGKFDLGVSNVTASFSSGNATVSEIEVEAPAYYNLGVVYNADSFASPYVFDGEGHDLGVLWAELDAKPSGSVTLEVRPLYFFETISGMELASTGLELFAATLATASTVDNGTYVALYGNTNSVQISDIQTSVEDAVMSGAVVKAGQGYIEVVGAATSSVYSVSGAMVGNDESRYDVVPGVYVVIADGKAVKVVVR